MNRNNKGFTLVELIVVLVILAILAAILMPTLLGYINKAREKKEINMAKAYLDASQGMLTEIYGKNAGTANGCVIQEPPEKIKVDAGNKGDVDARNSQFARNVFDLVSADSDPYVFMIAMANSKTNNLKPKNPHDQYIVYYALYMKDESSIPLYYYNGEWTKINPSLDSLGNKKIVNNNNNNSYKINGKTLYLQYYVLGKAGDRTLQNYWSWLKGDVAKRAAE